MNTLKLAKDDSIDEENLSNPSARSYERILEEEQPQRLPSRQGSQRGDIEIDEGTITGSDLSEIGDEEVKNTIHKKVTIKRLNSQKRESEPQILFNENEERAPSIMTQAGQPKGKGLEEKHSRKSKTIIIQVDDDKTPKNIDEKGSWGME